MEAAITEAHCPRVERVWTEEVEGEGVDPMGSSSGLPLSPIAQVGSQPTQLPLLALPWSWTYHPASCCHVTGVC